MYDDGISAAVLRNSEVSFRIGFVQRTWNGSAVVSEDTYIHDNATPILYNGQEELTNAWVIVSRSQTLNGRLGINGHVRLILMDGVTLTCTEGVRVAVGHTLTIYGQKKGSGKLTANGRKYTAGIGSNDQDDGNNDSAGTINICGGTIVAQGGEDSAGIGGGNEATGGAINIYGGTVNATGGEDAAGIGCDDNGRNTDATSIIIYKGMIDAIGGEQGAGIGGGAGDTGTPIYIHGGVITANGTMNQDNQDSGAGIGGGKGSGTRGVYITGGWVIAAGENCATGIGGGGGGGSIRNIHISGGTVIATGGEDAAGIGGGAFTNMKGTIKITGTDTKVKATGGRCGTGIGAGGYTIIDGGGDMRGKIIIDCGASSRIEVYGGQEGAGIGAGLAGNMTGSVTIDGGNVYVKANSHGGAGIGGGAELLNIGGEGGNVFINGGYVEIWGVSSGAESIGHGDDDSKSGTLKLADHLRVTVGGEPIKRSKRTSECHSRNKNEKCVIEACPHGDFTYMVTENGHTPVCAWCYAPFQEEAHTYDSNPACACGYQSGMVAVHFAPGIEGSAEEMPDMLVMPGEALALPVCGFTAPEGKCFGGWIWECDDSVYAPDDPFTVTEELTLTARWLNLYTVTFVYDETGAPSEYDGEMPPVSLAEGSVWILPECGFTSPAGMRFRSWMVKNDGDDGYTAMNDGDEITVTADVTAAAKWSAEIDAIFSPGYEGAPEENYIIPVALYRVFYLPACMFTPPDGYEFDVWERDMEHIGTMRLNPGNGFTVTGRLTVTALWKLLPSFSNAGFVLPAETTEIEASAFEGIAAAIVEIPINCMSIGDYAFRDCVGLTMIRIPADCTLGLDVFDGCPKVYIFSAAGSPAESYCQSHSNCVFVEDTGD